MLLSGTIALMLVTNTKNTLITNNIPATRLGHCSFRNENKSITTNRKIIAQNPIVTHIPLFFSFFLSIKFTFTNVVNLYLIYFLVLSLRYFVFLQYRFCNHEYY